jgi:capping protein beta
MDKIASSLSLMRRLPPSKVEQNLSGLLNLLPEETDELLQRVDQPLQEETCQDTVSGLAAASTGLIYFHFPLEKR